MPKLILVFVVGVVILGVAAYSATRTKLFTLKSGIRAEKYRWTNFSVYIDNIYHNEDEQATIRNAMSTLQQVIPCVKFEVYDPGAQPTGDYVHIQNGEGCRSVIGRQGDGKQILYLNQTFCMTRGTILHTLIHALGFDHEQSRPDRDDHVIIHEENIKPENLLFFKKRSVEEFSTFGVPYDKHSIMHSPADQWSKNGLPTITAKDGGTVGRLSDELRESDKQKLKAMYKC